MGLLIAEDVHRENLGLPVPSAVTSIRMRFLRWAPLGETTAAPSPYSTFSTLFVPPGFGAFRGSLPARGRIGDNPSQPEKTEAAKVIWRPRLVSLK
jgi:hypothetical protein